MAKYVIDGETLHGLADALRSVTGETRSYTPTEMIEAVTNIMETGTYILVDENGNEIPAVFVENKTAFNATANDIRLGKIAVTDSGVTEGAKEIPSYIVTEGYKIIPAGKPYSITFDDEMYDFTKLQAIVCRYSGSIAGSVIAEKVVIDDSVYTVNSSDVLANVERDVQNKSINLGIANNSGVPSLLRYFTYKEIY